MARPGARYSGIAAMPAERRLWDSSVIIGYLAGQDDLKEVCELIIASAERGEIEIIVATMATVEVAYLEGLSDEDSEAKIRELFGRDYITPVAIDMRVAAISRGLIRKYRTGPRLKPPDAIHLATAMQWRIPVLETTDPDLLRLNGQERFEGNEETSAITIRRPLYEGVVPIPGF